MSNDEPVYSTLDEATANWIEGAIDQVAQTGVNALALAAEQVAQQHAALARSRQLAAQQAQRVQLGLLPGTERLQAERGALLAAQALAAAQLARDQAVVALYKSLGGAPPFDGEATP